MFRSFACWSAIALPTAAILIAVAAVAFSLLDGETGPRAGSDFASAAAFAVLQTLAPIAIWVLLTTRWPTLRRHLALEGVLFPFAVAAVGGIAAGALGGPVWPSSGDALALSVGAWLGFSWALLCARALAEQIFARPASP